MIHSRLRFVKLINLVKTLLLCTVIQYDWIDTLWTSKRIYSLRVLVLLVIVISIMFKELFIFVVKKNFHSKGPRCSKLPLQRLLKKMQKIIAPQDTGRKLNVHLRFNLRGVIEGRYILPGVRFKQFWKHFFLISSFLKDNLKEFV